MTAFVVLAVALTLAIVAWRYPREMPSLFEFFGAAAGAVVITWLVFVTLHALAVRLNGGPFRKGDTVEILVGPHRGRIGRVYEEWRERGEVRVNLGAAAEGRLEDVFGQTQLVRARKPELADRQASPESTPRPSEPSSMF
ncbi:MAG: KOW motif-containing protein [Verrucomicrobia bacterium]|nr:KOW motif-containing protein [Verrucomicrobiota bacterium]